MKKRIFLTTGAIMCMAMTTFASEGSVSEENTSEAVIEIADELEVTQTNLYELSGEYSSDEAYFYAKVENNTAEGRYVGYGKLVCFSEDDDILVSDDYISTSPCSNIWLEPGEYIYIDASIWESELENADIADVKFSVKTGDYGYVGERIDCEAEYSYNADEDYDNEIYVTFSNPKDEPYDTFYISAALLDAEGNILYVTSGQPYDTLIHPGSTITQKLSISSSLCEYFRENEIEPASVEAFVYFIED